MSVAILALLGVMLLSAAVSGWLIRRNPQERAVKVMMFVGYFWLLTFLQLLVLALWYYLRQHYFD